MTLFAVSTTTPSQSSEENGWKELVFQPNNFLFLIPTITAVALGIIFVPHFGIGLAAGAGMLVATIVTMKVLESCGVIEAKEEKNSKYSRHIRENLLDAALFGPIVEESIFRGGLQPFLSTAIQTIVPAASSAFLGPAFSIATTVSIVATGIIFGAAHYANPHKAALQQAVAASVGGIAFGALAAQFGFGAAVAAHIANNSIITIVAGLLPSKGSLPTHSHKEFKNTPLPV